MAQAMDPASRATFTFFREQSGAEGHGPETVVILTFVDLGGDRTELTLRQGVFKTVSACNEHYIGWSSCLDRFAARLAARRTRGEKG